MDYLTSTINYLASLVETNLFIGLLALDSIIGSVSFVRTFFNWNLDRNQIVEKSNWYNSGPIDRLIYYLMIYGGYHTIKNFFWIDSKYYDMVYYVTSYFVLVPLSNQVQSTKFFNRIQKKKANFIKMLMGKIIVFLIRTYSRTFLKSEVIIRTSDVLDLFDSYDEFMGYIADILKNLLIILILSYIKKYSKKLYYKLIKQIYNYQTGDLLNSYRDTTTAQQYLLQVINKKNWTKLKSPNVYRAMIYLFQMMESDQDLIKEVTDELNFRTLRMFSFWTISSFFKTNYITAVFSVLFEIYDLVVRNWSLSNLTCKLLVAPIAYFSSDYFLVAFFSEFCDWIIVNNIFYIVVRTSSKTIKRFMKSLIKRTGLFYHSLGAIVFCIMLKYYTNIYTELVVSSIFLISGIAMVPIKKQLVFGFIILSSYLSEYSLLHIIHNTILLVLLSEAPLDNIHINTKSTSIKKNISFNDEIFEKSNEEFIDHISANGSNSSDYDIISEYVS